MTAFTTEKMAVLAPMPSASVRIVTSGEPGRPQQIASRVANDREEGVHRAIRRTAPEMLDGNDRDRDARAREACLPPPRSSVLSQATFASTVICIVPR